MSKYYYSLLFFLSFAFNLQSQTFKAGLVFGFTASQITGDNDAGFNKPGLEGGIKSLVNLGEKSDLSLELLYSQRGSKEEIRVDGTNQEIYRIDYISIPIVYSYKDWAAEEYYRLHFHSGLSYGRLIKAELDNGVDNSLFTDLWRKNDLSILVGATYYINKHFGLTFRYNRSLILLYKNSEDSPINANSLIPFNLSFQGLYMF